MTEIGYFGKSEEMPGELIGCLLVSEQNELRNINDDLEEAQKAMDRVQEAYQKFILRTLDRMRQFESFDPNVHLLFFHPDTGQVWKAKWTEIREWRNQHAGD